MRNEEFGQTSDKVHPSVGDSVYSRVRSDILQGALQPGMKLKLDSLRQAYDVSVNTLREALARIATEGLVEAEGQKGFRVVPVSFADLQEIGELRELIECHAVRHSVLHGDLAWESRVVAAHHVLAHYEQLMMGDSAGHRQEWQRHDREFHVALMSGCPSRWILRVHRMVHDQYRRYQLLALKTIGFRGQELIDEHRALLDSALTRNADETLRLLTLHIRRGTNIDLNELPDGPTNPARAGPAR